MENPKKTNPEYYEVMSDEIYLKISSLITSVCGINLPIKKKSMLQARLRKRMKQLQIKSYEDYCGYLFSKHNKQNEIPELINIISTNKTEFFRENIHFEFLFQSILPSFSEQNMDKLSIWSAGCSSGEEAYSIAMTMEEYNMQHDQQFHYHITGTDISYTAIEKAKKAIYNEEKITGVPYDYRSKYFLRSKDQGKKLLRIKPNIREKTSFFKLNLFNQKEYFKNTFDIIFCRNTLIYFIKENQEKIIKNIIRMLNKNGLLFIGHSESLFHFNLGLKNLKPTIYQKTN